MSSPHLGRLQELLGHTFADPALLREALTHPSTRDEGKERSDKRHDNERLEFLGDAVLQLAVTERLYLAFPGAAEGKLTPWRATLVSRAAMARVAEGLDLGAALVLSYGEERNAGRTRPSNLANAVEAIIGAVFRDAGWEAARDVVLRLLNPSIEELQSVAAAAPDAPTGNAKGDLQELLQKEGGTTPRYLCLKEEGAAHDRLYETAVLWGERELGRGTGKSKQEAEVNAARAALAVLRTP